VGGEGSEGGASSGEAKLLKDSGKEAWLCYVDGKLYLKVKVGMGPLDYAVVDPQTLSLEAVGALRLPGLEGGEGQQRVESSTGEPALNHASAAEGARVVAVPGAGVPEDEERLANLLLPAQDRRTLDDGTSR
jgi:hypothetical protein